MLSELVDIEISGRPSIPVEQSDIDHIARRTSSSRMYHRDRLRRWPAMTWATSQLCSVWWRYIRQFSVFRNDTNWMNKIIILSTHPGWRCAFMEICVSSSMFLWCLLHLNSLSYQAKSDGHFKWTNPHKTITKHEKKHWNTLFWLTTIK